MLYARYDVTHSMKSDYHARHKSHTDDHALEGHAPTPDGIVRLSTTGTAARSSRRRRGERLHKHHHYSEQEELFAVTSGNLVAARGGTGMVLEPGSTADFAFSLAVPFNLPGTVPDLCHGHAVRWTISASAKSRAALFSWSSAEEEIPVVAIDTIPPQSAFSRFSTYDRPLLPFLSK